jgi:hypothetical protein
MAFRYDSYCGIYCGSCPFLMGSERNELDTLVKKMKREKEELYCEGCKGENVSVFCRNCGLKECAQQHDVEFCFECSDYPCEKLQTFKNDDSPHNSAIFKKLDSLREFGLKKWLEIQKNRWSCPQCGTPFSWYDRECEECGHQLYNAVEEDRDIK